MPKKKQKKWNKKKAPNTTFLIDSAFKDTTRLGRSCVWHDMEQRCDECTEYVPDKYTYYSLWGDRAGKVMLKLTQCYEFQPWDHRKTTAEEQEKRRKAFGIKKGVYRDKNLPRRWSAVRHLTFSQRINPERPRLFVVNFDKERRGPSLMDMSYSLKVGEPHSGFGMWNGNDCLVEEFKKMVCVMRGIEYTEDFKLWHITMPLLANLVKYDDYDCGHKDRVPLALGQLFRHNSLTDAAHYVFRRTGKDLRRSIHAWIRWKQWGSMYAALAGRGLVADDHLRAMTIGHVYANWTPANPDTAIKKFRKMLKPLSENSRKRLITDDNVEGRYWSFDRTMADTWASFTRLTEYGVDPAEVISRRMPTSWVEYHNILSDRLNQEIRDRKAKEFKAMKMSASAISLCLDDYEFTTDTGKRLKFKVAKDGAEVVEWGHLMDHCIASYASQMAAGQCILFGVYEVDKKDQEVLLATGELGGVYGSKRISKLKQLYGKRNQPIGKADDASVRIHLCRVLPGISPGVSPHMAYGAARPENKFHGPVYWIPENEATRTLAKFVQMNDGRVALAPGVAPGVAPAPAGLPPAYIDDDLPF